MSLLTILALDLPKLHDPAAATLHLIEDEEEARPKMSTNGRICSSSAIEDVGVRLGLVGDGTTGPTLGLGRLRSPGRCRCPGSVVARGVLT